MNSQEKRLREYMKLPYTVILRRDEEGDFIARVRELEGCVADGQDEMEALGNLELVKALWIETALKTGQQIPRPEDDDELPSGKFLTRLPRSLHKNLVEIANYEGVSLNQLVTVALAELAGRRAAVQIRIHDLEASSQSQHAAGGYGSAQRVSRLWLVNSDRSKVPLEESGLLAERTVANVLSVQPLSGGTSYRKEA
jgi:antitoxin HicB